MVVVSVEWAETFPSGNTSCAAVVTSTTSVSVHNKVAPHDPYIDNLRSSVAVRGLSRLEA